MRVEAGQLFADGAPSLNLDKWDYRVLLNIVNSRRLDESEVFTTRRDRRAETSKYYNPMSNRGK